MPQTTSQMPSQPSHKIEKKIEKPNKRKQMKEHKRVSRQCIIRNDSRVNEHSTNHVRQMSACRYQIKHKRSHQMERAFLWFFRTPTTAALRIALLTIFF